MSAFCVKKSHAILCGIFTFIFLIIIDQYVKVWFMVQDGHEYLCNYGIAFGVKMPQLIFVLLWLVVMIVMSMLWYKVKDLGMSVHIAFLMIFAGAMSNVIDRLWHGCVIDYIPFFHISSYNFADFLIMTGAIILLWKNLESKK